MNNKTAEASSGKRRGRFNFIDFTLIVVALVALSVLVYIVVGPKNSQAAQPTTFSIQYTLEIKHLREDWRDYISIGDEITDADSLTKIGTVTDVSYQNEYVASTDRRTGEVIYVEYPDYVNMKVTVETDSVTKTDNGYLAGKKEFCIGSPMSLRLPKIRVDSSCTGIEVIGEVNKDAAN